MTLRPQEFIYGVLSVTLFGKPYLFPKELEKKKKRNMEKLSPVENICGVQREAPQIFPAQYNFS